MLKDVLDMEDFLESRKVSLIPHSVWKLSMETSLRVAVPFLPPPPNLLICYKTDHSLHWFNSGIGSQLSILLEICKKIIIGITRSLS